MSRLVASTVLIALILAGCGPSDDAASSADGAPVEALNVLSAEERADGWQLLFDGETTDGWHNYNADTLSSMWRVEGGTLMLAGRGGGDIVTDASFRNFELNLEWKISACGNNGLFFHAEEGHQHIWTVAPEYQLLDNTCADDNETPTHRAAANYDIHAPTEDATRPAGEWNRTRLVVDNGLVQHYLNGTKVVEYELGSEAWREAVDNSKFAPFPDYGLAGEGPIGLQDHGDPIWFRNIKVRPLPGAETATADA